MPYFTLIIMFYHVKIACYQFPNFVRSFQSFTFPLYLYISDSISLKFLSHASLKSPQQSLLQETSHSPSFSLSLTSLLCLISNFFLSLSFPASLLTA